MSRLWVAIGNRGGLQPSTFAPGSSRRRIPVTFALELQSTSFKDDLPITELWVHRSHPHFKIDGFRGINRFSPLQEGRGGEQRDPSLEFGYSLRRYFGDHRGRSLPSDPHLPFLLARCSVQPDGTDALEEGRT